MRVKRFSRAALFAAVSATALMGANGAFAQSADEPTETEEVIVLGVRGAQAAAIDIKRNANTVVDSISAEDIGKLPDVTIADSLQRVTGVQIRRTAGEGGPVNVRGLPQVGTLLNGEQFIGSGSVTTVQPDFTDIPSQLFAGADVYKSDTASLLNGGVTGTINLRTRRPFDLRDGVTLAGAVETAHGSVSDQWDPQLNFLVGYREANWGALFSASYSDVTLDNQYNGIQRDYGGNFHSEACGDAYGWAGFRYGGPNDGNGADGHRGVNINADGCPAGQFNIDVNGDGDANDVFFSPQAHTGWDRLTQRERIGINASFQADLGNGFELVADAFYTDTDSWTRTAGFQFQAKNWQGAEWVPGASRDTGVLRDGMHFNTVQVYNYDMPSFDSYSETHAEFSSSENFNIELRYDNGGAFTGSVRALYAQAERTHDEGYLQFNLSAGNPWGTCSGGVCGTANATPGFLHFPAEFGGDRFFNPLGYIMNAANLPATVDYRGEDPVFTLPSSVQAQLTNPDTYALKTMSSENNYRRNSDLSVFRADGRYEFNERFDLQFGLRYSTREAENYAFERASPFYGAYSVDENGDPVPGGCLVKWKAVDVAMNQGAGDQACWAYDADGAFIANYQTAPASDARFAGNVGFYDGIPVGGIPGIYVLNPEALDNPEAFIEGFFPGQVNVQRPGLSYGVGIDQWSAYFQGNFSGNIGVPYTANIGVRYIETTLDVDQHITGAPQPYGLDAQDLGIINTERTFTDVLPAANIAFELQDDLILRLAYAKTMQLLDLDTWGGGLQINYASPPDFQPVGGTQFGNPTLDPWRSDNFDASLEWYLSDSSLLSAAAFYIQVESFIEGVTLVRTDLPSLLGVVTGDPVNIGARGQGEGRDLKGVELSWRQALSFLDDPFLSNLGFDLNYTYAPSESGGVDLSGAEIPFQDNSKHQANVILWYQGDRFQARIAENYRSTRAAGDISGLTLYQEPTWYLDASASFDITPDLTLYVQGSNLTEEREDYYLVWKDQRAYSQLYERRITLGLRARF